MISYLFVVFVLILILIEILLNYNEKAQCFKKIPGPQGYFIFGNTLQIIVSPVELMKLRVKWSKKYSGLFKFWGFFIGAVCIYNPEDIEVVLSSIRHNEKSLIYWMLKPWLRDGLLVSNGETWHHRRKLLTPAFHFNILRQFFIILRENSERLVERLDEFAVTGEKVDVTPILSEFTLNSICETAMGTKLNEEVSGAGKTYKNAIHKLGHVLIYRMSRLYLFNDFVFSFSSASNAMRNHLKTIHKFTERVIRARRDYVTKNGFRLPKDDDSDIYRQKRKTAMLDLLLLAENDDLINMEGIQAEVDTFMFEGHDTTATGLTYCLLSLANNKAVQDKIYIELQEIFGNSTRPATVDDLSKMKYLEMCIKESLRMYPPVHLISRNIRETTMLSGYKIPSNTICHIDILNLHRCPKLYKDPLVFDPDRFLPENIAARHPYAYIPFSAGPRNCIGQKFAMMEMKSAVSEILRKFELKPVTRHEDIEFMADLVLRNSGPIYVKFVKR